MHLEKAVMRERVVATERAAERKRAASPEQYDGNERHEIHVEKHYDEPSGTVVMFCGAVATINDNADLEPAGMDFFMSNAGGRATCQPCLDAWNLIR